MDRVKLALASRKVSGVTGTSTTIFEHAKRLSALGWDVHVYGDDVDSRRARGSGATPHVFWSPPLGSDLRRRYFDWRAGRAIAAGGFDLTHGHGDTTRQDVLSLHNCVHAAHEAVYGSPLPEDSSIGRWHGKILREQKFRLLIANSRLMREDLLRRFAVPNEKVAVIHPGHDPARFRPEDRERGRALRARWGVRAGDAVVGLITSGDFAKRGVGNFLTALALLPSAFKAGLHAVVIGSESRLARYRALAAQTGLGERLRFMPVTADVAACYHALDVYVHPALFEEFGQSVQEAMACAVPVLTSRQVGAAELFPEEAKPFLMDHPVPEAIAAGLSSLLQGRGRRETLGAALCRAARSNTWDANFKATFACYERLFARTEALV